MLHDQISQNYQYLIWKYILMINIDKNYQLFYPISKEKWEINEKNVYWIQ